jgi:hypothetical protein
VTADARTAAERLGCTQSAVHDWIRCGRLVASGRPFLVDDDSIRRVAGERRLEALGRIGDEVELARKVVSILDPKPVVIRRANGNADADSLAASMSAPRGPDALHLVPAEAWPAWGPTVLRSAAARPTWNTSKRGCLTCWTRISASVHQTLPPRGDAACRLLLGGGCGTCQAAFAAEKKKATQQLRALSASVRADRDRDQAERIRAEWIAARRGLDAAGSRFAAASKAREARGVPRPPKSEWRTR